MRFSPQRYNRFLNNIGQDVEWRRAWSCSCVNPSSGSPDAKCRLCVGKGYIWDPAVKTRVGIASQDLQTKWAKMGRWEAGDMVLVVPECSVLWDAGKFDRVTQLNSTDRFSLALVHGSPAEKLQFVTVDVDRCFWRDPATHTLIEGGIPEIVNGVPTWPGGVGEPPAGLGYSLTGTRRSEYFVYDTLPSDRNQHAGARLPKQVVMRRFDLFGR